MPKQSARFFQQHRGTIRAVVHTAAQPSHDWAARDPQTDFTVNANGTLNLLEAARENCPEAPFVFTSTNKVYGDTPNRLPLRELEMRWEIEPGHEYEPGISETMSIDARSIRSSARRKPRPTFWCRNTAAISECRRRVFAAAV